jgi:hypothetical protein
MVNSLALLGHRQRVAPLPFNQAPNALIRRTFRVQASPVPAAPFADLSDENWEAFCMNVLVRGVLPDFYVPRPRPLVGRVEELGWACIGILRGSCERDSSISQHGQEGFGVILGESAASRGCPRLILRLLGCGQGRKSLKQLAHSGGQVY